jgi:hypothetical protein
MQRKKTQMIGASGAGVLAAISLVAALAAVTAVNQQAAFAAPSDKTPSDNAGDVGWAATQIGDFTQWCKNEQGRSGQDCARNDNNGEYQSNVARNYNDRSDHNNILDDEE